MSDFCKKAGIRFSAMQLEQIGVQCKLQDDVGRLVGWKATGYTMALLSMSFCLFLRERLVVVNKLSEPSKKSDTSLAAFSHTKAQTQLKRKRVLADTGTPNRFVTPSYRPGQPESKKAVQAENSGVISSMHTGFEPADQKPPSKRRLLFMTDAWLYWICHLAELGPARVHAATVKTVWLQ